MTLMETRTGREPAARRTDRRLIASSLCAVLILGLFLPMLPWIRIENAEALHDAMQLKSKAAAALGNAYSPLNFLSFVETSGKGLLGPYAFLLLLICLVSIFLALYGLALVCIPKLNRGKGNLKRCSMLQKSMTFAVLAGLGTLLLCCFGNHSYGLSAFRTCWPSMAVMVLGIAGYCLSKRLEKEERSVYKEHGFVEEVRRNWLLFVFLIPCFAFFLINNYLPMFGVYFAFTKFNFRDSLFASPFVGLDNFRFLFRSEIMHLTSNTILYNLVFIVVGNVLQIFFAILISHVASKPLKRLSQTLIFMPYFVSYVILRVLVFNLFEYDVGLINNLVTSLGWQKIDFYNSPSYWPFLITIFYLWKNIGYGMVVYLATITGISTDYYEAAQIDGASIYQQIWYITVPLLKPTFIILLLYALGGIMKGQFELFYQLIGNNGTLFSTTDIFDTYVYRITTTQPLSMGMGTAAGLFQSLFGFVVIMLTNFFIKRKNPEYALF